MLKICFFYQTVFQKARICQPHWLHCWWEIIRKMNLLSCTFKSTIKQMSQNLSFYPEQRFLFSCLALSDVGRTLASVTVAKITEMIKTDPNIVQVCLVSDQSLRNWGDIFIKLRSATVAPMQSLGHGNYIQIQNTFTSLDTNIIGHQIIHESDYELHSLQWVIRSGINWVLIGNFKHA